MASDSTGKALSEDDPTLQIPVTRPVLYLYFWLTSYKSDVPTTPSFGLINLLQLLAEFRKSVYSLDYHFITKDIKGYKSIARWKDAYDEVPNKKAFVVALRAQHGETKNSTSSIQAGSPGNQPPSLVAF